MGKNYSAQEKHIRKNYARFPLDLRPETLEEFKKVCKENGNKEVHCFVSRNSAGEVTKRAAGYAAFFSYAERRNENAQTFNVEGSPKNRTSIKGRVKTLQNCRQVTRT